jgi:hypothetical protein
MAPPACCNCSPCLFTVCMGKCPSPTSGRACHTGKSPSALLPSSGCPTLFATCPFFQLVVYYFLFVCFLRGRDQYVQGALLISLRGGCGRTVCHLFHLLLTCGSANRIRSWCLEAQESSWFLLILWCWGPMCRLGVWRCKVLPLLGGYSCPVFLWHLRKIFTLRNTHYLPPPSSHHS